MNRFVLIFIISLVSYYGFSTQIDSIYFSHEPGFYQKPFYLKINKNKGDIYIVNNDDKVLFRDSILINKTTTISLIYDYNDSISKLGSYSYFIDFNTQFKVVSISINSEHLFNYYRGIYMKGPKAYFDTIANHYKNVNWKRNWERENYIEIFDEEKNRIISQFSGIKIFGGMTRYYPEKSLRLIARSKYGSKYFNADLFNTGFNNYKQFILRHSGNDYRKLRFRDAFVTSLASESKLDVQASSPAHLYVNSEYWGVYNIREKINKFYIDNNHNTGLSSIDILQGYKTVENGSDKSYIKLIKLIKDNNIKDVEIYSKVQTMMDTRNFINFWIHQIHSANKDVRGNIRFWKSDSLDGKFRWIVYDTDLGFGANRYQHKTLEDFTSSKETNWYNPKWATFLLRNLLKNNDFKKDFINQSAYILSSTLSSKNISRRIDEFKYLYKPEMLKHFSSRRKFQRYQGNLNKWESSLEDLYVFGEYRDEISFVHLQSKFNLDKPYFLQLKINNPEMGEVHLNGNLIKGEIFAGRFFSELSLPILINPYVGFRSEGYNLDTIASIDGDSVFVEISFSRNKKSQHNVIINEIDYTNDCFEIFNQSDFDINLNGWTVIDKDANIHTISDRIIRKKRFLVFYNDIILDAIDTVEYININFRLSSHSEFLILFDNNGCMVDSVSYKINSNKKSYSRYLPFMYSDTLLWLNNSDYTIGYHNNSYTSFLEEKNINLMNNKKYRFLYLSLGISSIILIYFLLK